MQVQPYLMFDGRCEEAADFYINALGAEVLMKMRFDESPDPHPPGMVAAGAEKKIMHMSLRIGDSTVMASDGGRCTGRPKFDGVLLTLTAWMYAALWSAPRT